MDVYFQAMIAQVRRTTDELHRHQQRVDKLSRDRSYLLYVLHKRGYTQQAIADALGMTKARVQQLISAERAKRGNATPGPTV